MYALYQLIVHSHLLTSAARHSHDIQREWLQWLVGRVARIGGGISGKIADRLEGLGLNWRRCQRKRAHLGIFAMVKPVTRCKVVCKMLE